MNPRRVLVTGGAGFIGSHLVERLLAEGFHVSVVDDLSTGALENLRSVAGDSRLEFVEGRVSEHPELDRLVSEAEFVYHLAASVGVELVVRSPIETIHNNLKETEAVLQAAVATATPVMLTSTSEVYGKSTRPAFSEEDDLLIGPPTLGRWSYACSKLMDEFMAMAFARERGLPVIVTRLFNTVGPRQTGRYGMVLPRFIEAARRGEPLRIFGDGRQTRCFCYVADTVEALFRLQQCAAARGEVVNVGSDVEVSIRGLAELVVETLGSQSLLAMVPYEEAYAPGFEDMLRRRPVVEKCRRLTGFHPSTSLVEIIRRTASGG